jgi:hypothetical protein
LTETFGAGHGKQLSDLKLSHYRRFARNNLTINGKSGNNIEVPDILTNDTENWEEDISIADINNILTQIQENMNISGNLTVGSNVTIGGQLLIDTINENTTNNGVVIEGVTINSGNITATTFIGDGSQLTGINEDQIVTITEGENTTVSGTYPNFTISSTNTDTNTTYRAGTGVTLSGTTFNIGQWVGTSNSVTFSTINVGHILPRYGANYTYNIGSAAAQYLIGYAFIWSSSSDDRLKDNETDISSALETIMKLKPQTYDFKNSEEPDAKYLGLRSGFIAQDVLQIPELAHAVNVPENETEKVEKELDENGNIIDSDKEKKCYLSLDYNTIFTHAVKAIQELNEEVKNLKAKIEILEAK